ncbi:MAG: hypothetical protein COB51_08350 [Moraxellaceae bacterium]|nr:MAG: hypothetical protein COB51_08350 [Moraxellaceae bacterium]
MLHYESSRLKILLIEDERWQQEYIAEMLDGTGLDIELDVAATGREAIDKYKKISYSCILLDYILPDMNGQLILGYMQGDGHNLDIPVIALTGTKQKNLSVELMESGVVEFIEKEDCSSDILKTAILHSLARQNFTSSRMNIVKSSYEKKIVAYQGREETTISSRKAESSDTVEYLSLHDFLTGLPNRYSCEMELGLTIENISRDEEGEFGVICLGIDKFKQVNEVFGHSIGDNLLINISERLKSQLNESEYLCRLSADQFIIICRKMVAYSRVNRIANHAMRALAKAFAVAENTIFVTASVGIVYYPDGGLTPEVLLKHAELAMFSAKEEGGNTIVHYSNAAGSSVREKFAVYTGLHQAILNQEFELYYQPKVCFRTGKVLGAEALIRWFHPERGLIPADEFISVAEGSDLINRITDWVLLKSFQQIKYWRSEQLTDARISINISGRNFQHDHLVEEIEIILDKHQLDPKGIELEITEQALVENQSAVKKEISKLKSMGFKISLDDFGTGYSSLSYLQTLKVDIIKIDRSFIQNIETESGRSIVQAILAMAHALKMTVVAEGIETHDQHVILKALGCDIGQGYLYSRALNADEFVEFCNASRNKH